MRFTEFLKTNASWLWAGVLLTFMSSFGQTFFISIFGGHIREEFGLSHAAWGGIYSLGTTASAVVMIWAGVLTDIFRTRILGVIVFFGLALAAVAMAGLHSAVYLPFVIFALRFFGQGMCSHLAVVAMSRWFVANRGRALSLATLGFSFGEAVLPIVFVFFMGYVAWHKLWLVAALLLLFAAPLLWWLLKEERTPQALAQENISPGMNGRHWTRRQALSHPLFWFMVPALLGPSAFGTAFFFHQVHYSEIKGWDHIAFVSLLPVYTASGVLAMLVSGWALDKFGTARLIPFYQFPLSIAFICFSQSADITFLFVGLLFFAMTSGANATLPNAFWAEFYGTQHLGAIKAMAAAVMVLGSAIGPGITGVLIDAGIALDTQYLWIAGFFLLCSLSMLIGVSRSKSALQTIFG